MRVRRRVPLLTRAERRTLAGVLLLCIALTGCDAGGAEGPSSAAPSASAAPSGPEQPSAPASGEPSPSVAASVATAPSRNVVPAWWPADLPVARDAQVLEVNEGTCEVSWMAPGAEVDAIAAEVTGVAEESGWKMSMRSARELVLPTPSVSLVPPAFPGDPGEGVAPQLRARASIQANRDGVSAVLALDEMDGAVVLGRYRLLDSSCS